MDRKQEHAQDSSRVSNREGDRSERARLGGFSEMVCKRAKISKGSQPWGKWRKITPGQGCSKYKE